MPNILHRGETPHEADSGIVQIGYNRLETVRSAGSFVVVHELPAEQVPAAPAVETSPVTDLNEVRRLAEDRARRAIDYSRGDYDGRLSA